MDNAALNEGQGLGGGGLCGEVFSEGGYIEGGCRFSEGGGYVVKGGCVVRFSEGGYVCGKDYFSEGGYVMKVATKVAELEGILV